MTSPASSALPASESAVLEAVALGIPAALSDLGGLVRIPGIAWPAFDQTQLERSADAIAALVRDIGIFDDVRVLRAHVDDTDELGQPAVLATRAARNGRPTILLYAHHDVQPPGDDELWETPPFEPTVRAGRLYGRGAADDKAGIMAHIASLRAVSEVLGDDFDLGVALFIEGEEEYGSRSFARFLRDNVDALRADAIVVADSGNLDSETPGLTVSLRGNARFTLRIRTLEHASHSGMFGGAVPDAMMAAVTLLATLWDADGAVAVDGMTGRAGETPDYSEATLRDEAGLLAGTSPIGRAAVDLGVGGSIPFIADLVREFPDAQILVTGVEDPHSRAHSPNESLHLQTFRNAIRTEALLLTRMNDLG
jgi:acetylornithine deacetylase/succinyl-diaminopimelate desuccinylase-like protein